MKTSFGKVKIDTPRDRKGEFEPALLQKNQTSITTDIEDLTTADIETYIKDIYRLEVSDSTVSRITDKILPVVKEWQQRPLENVYGGSFYGCDTLSCS